MNDASRAAELAARNSYGRLLAFLSVRSHDIAQAEDALGDAFAKALSHWPEHGVPANPDAWLLTVARNRLTDQQRQQTRFPTDSETPDMPCNEADENTLPDERLLLLMVCAHPAIAAELHTPLMLQTVLGLEAKAIARLFMVSPTALSKRLVRAKVKIRDAGIPFQLPDADTLPARSAAILEALYALHAHDWLDPTDTLGDEALYLAELLCQLMPDNAEVLGLAALIAFSHARAHARIVDNTLVPTPEQDTSLWDDQLIAYGKRQLSRAHKLGAIGRFQIEAAIEAVHITRKQSRQTDWPALYKLYHAHLQTAPSAGGLIAQAVVTARLHGTAAGLAALDAAQAITGTAFQPLWAARAELHSQGMQTEQQTEQAISCYEKALGLTTDKPTHNFLSAKLLLCARH